MTKHPWGELALAVVLVAVAGYAPHLNLDEVVSGTALDAGRAVVGVLGVAMLLTLAFQVAGTAPKPGAARLHVVAGLLVLLAIYLPQLPFGDLLDFLFNSTGNVVIEPADETAATMWLRLILLALAAAIAAMARFSYLLEGALATGAVLVSVAALAVVGDVLADLDAKAASQKTEAAFDRGFSLPAGKLQVVTRDLAADRCVTVTVVYSVDPDPATDANPLVYRSHGYQARLVTPVKAGKPSDAAEVELGTGAQNGEFARRLIASSAVYLHSTAADQQAKNPPNTCTR